mgnify:CR=1 FL=1
MDKYHTSVLLRETVELLHINPGKKYIDATLGGGGHTGAILEKGGKVLGIDFDQDAIDFVEKEVRSKNQEVRERLRLARGNFKDIDALAKENDFEHVAGIVFDLGVSGHHFDEAQRGFRPSGNEASSRSSSASPLTDSGSSGQASSGGGSVDTGSSSSSFDFGGGGGFDGGGASGSW